LEPFDRRTALKLLAAWLAAGLGRPAPAGANGAGPAPAASAAASNFRAVYGDPVLRERFHDFLKHVFSLYPDDRLHALIAELAARGGSDREIYGDLQARLPEITPPLSILTHALPALAEQKRGMAAQAAALLGRGARASGYVEIGAPGRYLNPLREVLAIDGPVFVVNDFEPGFAPEHVVERGQLRRAGRYVPLGEYEGFGAGQVPTAGVDLSRTSSASTTRRPRISSASWRRSGARCGRAAGCWCATTTSTGPRSARWSRWPTTSSTPASRCPGARTSARSATSRRSPSSRRSSRRTASSARAGCASRKATRPATRCCCS